MTAIPTVAASLFERLKQCGDPRKSWRWPKGDPDYVAKLGLGPEHVPVLMEIARLRIDEESLPDDPVAWHAPIHAWRAMAQLRAVPAVSLLLDMLDPMDAAGDQWHLEEFPQALALIGTPAFDPVAGYLADESHADFSRACAAHSLCCIAQKHVEMRERAVASLSERLSEHERMCDLNAFLISYLIRLKATESAELIERVYAAGHVDEQIVGDWGTVRRELGVEGIGLVSQVPARRRPLLSLRPPESSVPEPTGRSFKSRERQKLKKQRSARRRNRGKGR